MKRYCILGVARPYGEAEEKWLAYPITHYALEAGQAAVDRMNNAAADAVDRGYVYPFERYELIEVGDELVGQWDERRKQTGATS